MFEYATSFFFLLNSMQKRVYYKTRNTVTQNYGTWNTGGTYNRILAEQSEYHGIVEHEKSKTTKQHQEILQI